MIPVSPGDWDHSKDISRSEDSGPECGSAVRKNADSVPNARNLVVVKEAKSGDGERRDQSYPKCPLMRENFRSNMKQRGVVDGSRGMIKDREQNGRFSTGDHRMMHNAAGITQSSRLCPL